MIRVVANLKGHIVKCNTAVSRPGPLNKPTITVSEPAPLVSRRMGLQDYGRRYTTFSHEAQDIMIKVTCEGNYELAAWFQKTVASLGVDWTACLNSAISSLPFLPVS